MYIEDCVLLFYYFCPGNTAAEMLTTLKFKDYADDVHQFQRDFLATLGGNDYELSSAQRLYGAKGT